MYFRFKTIATVGLWLIGTGVVTASTQPSPAGLPVGTIEIINHEVFDEPDAGVAAPYRIANTVHIRTRDAVSYTHLTLPTILRV